MSPAERRFVQIADALREPNAWTNNEWLCRPDLVAAEKLLLVRANMDPLHCHPFHYHPHREEIIYVIEGQAEQWVGNEHRLLKAGEMARVVAIDGIVLQVEPEAGGARDYRERGPKKDEVLEEK